MIFKDDYFTYSVDGGNLIVVEKSSGEYITIENFNDGDLGIGLDDKEKKDVQIYVSDARVTEGGDLEFIVAVDNTLEEDLKLSVDSYFTGKAEAEDLSSSYSGTVTIKAGEYTSTFTIETEDDDIEVMNTGEGTILCNVFGHEVINDLSCKYRRVA